MSFLDEQLALFDKEFTRTGTFGEKRLSIIRPTNYTRNNPIIPQEEQIIADLKSFLTSSITQAQAQEKERLKKEVEQLHPKHWSTLGLLNRTPEQEQYDSGRTHGYTQAVEVIISHLTKE